MNQENQALEPQIVEKDELVVTHEIKQFLRETAKWAKFLAILGFVFSGLMVFLGFFMGIAMSLIPEAAGTAMPFPSYLLGIVYLIMGVIYFFPLLYLLRFANGIQKALMSNNSEKLASAFKNLKSHYRFFGIFCIVMIAVYIIGIIIAVIVGASSGLGSALGGFPA